MTELLSFVDRWAPLAVLIIQPVFFGVIWCLKQTFVQADQFSDVVGRVARVENRVTSVENRLETMPGADTAQELLVSLTRLEGSVRAMDERVSGMLTNLNLLMRVHTGDGK